MASRDNESSRWFPKYHSSINLVITGENPRLLSIQGACNLKNIDVVTLYNAAAARVANAGLHKAYWQSENKGWTSCTNFG